MTEGASAPRPSFLEHRAAWLAAVVALVAGLATMTSDPIGVFNDDGIYLLTAKALAEGLGYVYPQLPGHPPAIHYPPAWPALLAIVWKVAPEFPGNIGWLKLINPVITACAAAGSVVLGRRLLGLPWWLALAATLLAVVSVPMLLLTNLLLSEPLFLALLLPTLLVTERLVRGGGGTRLAVLAAVLMASLVLVRTLGGTVFVAAIMLLAYERRWRDLGTYFAVTVALLAPWQWFVWQASVAFPDELRGSYGPYLEWVADGYREGGLPLFAAVLRKNVAESWEMAGILFSPVPALRGVAAAAAMVALAFGLWTLWASARARVTALALVGYLAVVVAWPFWVDRFYWVMWPPIVLVMTAGAHGAWTALRAPARPRLAMAVLVASCTLLAGHAAYNVGGIARGWEASASAEMGEVGVRMMRQVNGDRRLDGKVIAAELAPMVAIYTGLQVLPLEILAARDHVVAKSIPEHAAELERIDRRYRPEAYLVRMSGAYYAALRAATFDPGRTLVDVSPPGAPVRTILVQQR